MTFRSLLLLPPPPEPSTYAAVKAAYHAPLLLALRSSSLSGTSSILDIAVPCTQLYERKDQPRAASYNHVQSILAKLYKLVTIVAARDHINTEDSSGVDVRVIPIAYPRNGKPDAMSLEDLARSTEGPVVDIAVLGRCHKRWSRVYAIESEEGEQILKNFATGGVARTAVQKLRGGIVSVDSSLETSNAPQHADRLHYHPAVGGTFDHLHIGHKLLLTMTIFMCDAPKENAKRAVTVGITAEDLLKNKKYAEFLQDWHERYAITHEFLHALLSFDPKNEHPEEITEVKDPGANGHVVTARYPSGLSILYTEIWDPFGPTITVEKVDALVISAETRAGGKAVNDKRREQGWYELDVFEVDVLDAEDGDEAANEDTTPNDNVQQAFQNKLSSTEIRKKQALAAKARSKV